MKLKTLSKALIIVLLVISCKIEHPKISFNAKTIDIGEVKKDTIIDVFFEFSNNSNSVLEIEKITSECHCTVAHDYQKKIGPNQKGKIRISYHVLGLGYFEQLVEVFSNAEGSASLLVIKGTVIHPEMKGDYNMK